MYTIEENRWLVTLAGRDGDYPLTNEAGFLEFAKSLPFPLLYESIKNAQPISPIYAYQRTENHWRHYEKLSKFPEGLLIIGDAFCAFNPVYGQGMTVAALGAITFDECLDQSKSLNLNGLWRHFHRQLSKAVTTPWLMATGEDFRYPTTQARKPNPITRLTQLYMDRIMLLSAENADIYKLFVEVMHLLKPPTVFFHPRIIFNVLAQTFRRYFQVDEVKQFFTISELPLRNPN